MKKLKRRSGSQPKIQCQKLKASIDIFENCIVASRYEATVERRYVTSSDVAAMFANEGGDKMKWFGDLENVVAAGMAANGDFTYLVVRPAGETIIRIRVGNKCQLVTVNMPSLLAKLTRRGKKWKSLDCVWAFKGKLKASTALYVPPLPNMYADAKVCLGSVAISKSEAEPAECFEDVFIKSVFTDHRAMYVLNPAGEKKFRNILDAIRKGKGCVDFKYLKKVTEYGKIFK